MKRKREREREKLTCLKLLVKFVDLRQNILLFFPHPIELLRVLQYRDNVRRRHCFDGENNNHDPKTRFFQRFCSHLSFQRCYQTPKSKIESGIGIFPIFILFFFVKFLTKWDGYFVYLPLFIF